MAISLPPAINSWQQFPDWYRALRAALQSGTSSVAWTAIDFTSSNITDILTRNHNSLQNIQGGSAGDYNHLTTAQVALVTGAIQDPGSNGLIARTAANTYAARTLTAPAAGITISNPAGTAGNPTFALANDLSALEALSGTGFAKRTGSDTWALDTATVDGPGSSTDNAIVRWDGTGGTVIQNSSVTITDGGEIDLVAGTTSVAPVKYQSGTNLTTATAGAMEYDGVVHYSTHAANERGVDVSQQFICLDATYTLTSQTALQKIFNSSTNGAVTLASSTTYMFEGLYVGTGFSASSGYVNTAFGGTATLTNIRYEVVSNKATLGTIGNCQSANFSVATASQATNANTATEAHIVVRGVVRINAGGTFIPQIGMAVAAAAVMQINSFFRIWPVGTNTVNKVGNWS